MNVSSCSAGGTAGAGALRRLGGAAHRLDCGSEHFFVEAGLAVEVIVDRGDVRAGPAADVAHGDLGEAALGKQPGGGREQPLARLEVLDAHSVRLNSTVAAVIATAPKISRNVRSKAIAPKPVFLSSRHLNA